MYNVYEHSKLNVKNIEDVLEILKLIEPDECLTTVFAHCGRKKQAHQAITSISHARHEM